MRGKALAKAEELLETVETPLQFQQWAYGTGITVDKKRLETGEATSRTETAGAVVIYVPQSPRLTRPEGQVVDVTPPALPEGTD